MNEISKLLKMNYEECYLYLQEKYGIPKRSYFANENCKSTPKEIIRTSEGLYIHHCDEDKAIQLSTREYAIKNSFEFQQPNRLVYCDLLEHLVLHIKILENPNPNKNPNENVGYGGIFNFMIPELNDIYSGISYKQNHKIFCANKVANRYNEYLKCIEYLIENFDYDIEEYLTSLNYSYGNWDRSNNLDVFKDIIDIYDKRKK